MRGRITVHGPDHAGAYRWKITIGDRSAAAYLAAGLGSFLSEGEAGWEMITLGPLLCTLVAAEPSGELVVSFTAAPDSHFALVVPSWQVAHLCTPDVRALLQHHPGTTVPAELTVHPADITTRGGRQVRYGLPKLAVRAGASRSR